MAPVERLRVALSHGPVTAAFAVWREVVHTPDAAPALVVAAMLAADPRAPMGERVAALLLAALIAQQVDSLPPAALDALDDDLLIDAVISHAATPAITGLLAIAGDRIAEPTRRYLTVRLVGAGVTGAHVAALQLDAGDVPGAVRSLIPELGAAAPAGISNAGVLALAQLLVQWSNGSGRAFADQLSTQLSPDVCRAFAEAARLLGATSEHPVVDLFEQRAALRR